ncbi:hypothetical protein [Tetragenococcus halophilus]|uniref:Uncharacterized protein n=1 Tax=Tetragenococcus halophilus TaxID=51669 RepID=A0AB35HM46_TETHA|nr:hypothetical protein [Tetragenococcus halophilus]MCO8288286.1 hypothetical protein [Tetragenococcus halophilus]MCO8290237.1 hypothetical protein [Tetragenococcus halophilus]MCO8294668.1 hypothetical protein [Tetragenococcus halophilus]MCO8297319.1 hypothetical protein [Tetragenococcus halophilus]NWN99281.1 hypothetical protein [Tetragenococcus halophilus]
MMLKIAGYFIQVEEDANLLANQSRIGEYSPYEQKIRLSNNLNGQQKDETLIHEILEAINDIYELGLDHNEQLCKLSVAIHQILTDNKHLLNVYGFYV